ncbi:STAS domain-containing protein [Nonomuraea sp. NPDC050691]|uniref:STAS domain-containing protein n=1 Tax=Nonomuraea sp. NPDC050691 TaxID=3155661 RepID=UPI0033C9171D
MTELTISTERHPHSDLVRIAGDLDRTTHDQLTATLQPLVSLHRPRIIVDAAKLSFCDSGGVRKLIDSQRQAESTGGGLRLIGVHGYLARLLTVAHLVDVFPPYGSFEHANRWPTFR